MARVKQHAPQGRVRPARSDRPARFRPLRRSVAAGPLPLWRLVGKQLAPDPNKPFACVPEPRGRDRNAFREEVDRSAVVAENENHFTGITGRADADVRLTLA